MKRIDFALALTFAITLSTTALFAQQGGSAKPAQGGISSPQPSHGQGSDLKSRSGPPGPQPWIWWQDEAVKKELALTPEQSQKIQQIWDENRPKLEQIYKEYDKERTELDRLTSVDVRADVMAVSLQMDRVEALRSLSSKTRNLMLYRMHLRLNKEQDQKLKPIMERRESERARRGGGLPRF